MLKAGFQSRCPAGFMADPTDFCRAVMTFLLIAHQPRAFKSIFFPTSVFYAEIISLFSGIIKNKIKIRYHTTKLHNSSQHIQLKLQLCTPSGVEISDVARS
jgi:hypothetical protein